VCVCVLFLVSHSAHGLWIVVTRYHFGLGLLCKKVSSYEYGLEEILPKITSGSRGDEPYSLMDQSKVNLTFTKNQRDIDLAPPILFASSAVTTVLQTFFEGYKTDFKTFCIGGPSGVGKSIAAHLLAAQLLAQVPNARVLYNRTGLKNEKLTSRVQGLGAQGLTTFLFVDQIRRNSVAVDYAALSGAYPSIWVILVASANLPMFHRDGSSDQGIVSKIQIPYRASKRDCITLQECHQTTSSNDEVAHSNEPVHGDEILSNDEIMLSNGLVASDEPLPLVEDLRRTDQFEPFVSRRVDRASVSLSVFDVVETKTATAPDIKMNVVPTNANSPKEQASTLQTVLDAGLDVVKKRYFETQLGFVPHKSVDLTNNDAFLEYVGYHLMTVSHFQKVTLSKLTFERHFDSIVKMMSDSFTTSKPGREADHIRLYVAVVEMCNQKRRSVSSGHKMDYRFFEPGGEIGSDLLLAAYHHAIQLRPPPDVFVEEYWSVVNKNPSELGFYVERQVLQDKQLLDIAEKCLNLVGISLGQINDVRRIGYTDVQQIVEEAREMKSKSTKFALHAIPLGFNFKSVDGIQIYVGGDDCYVLGNSITVQTTKEHLKSLAWFTDCTEIREGLTKALGFEKEKVHVYLVSTAKMVERLTGLALAHDDMQQLKGHAPRIMEFNILDVVSASCVRRLGLDASARTYSARLLSLTQFKCDKCSCQKSNCNNNYCSCRKAGQKCGDQCECLNCKNK